MIPRATPFEDQSSGGHGCGLTRNYARHCCLFLFAFLWAAFDAGAARGETLSARISVVSLAPARVKIEGERTIATRAWSFLNSYAGVMNLGDRIENLSLMDSSGAIIAVRKLAPGEYTAASLANRFSYEVRLDAPAFERDAAHVSWLTVERGFLMLGDLLPRIVSETGAANSNAVVRFSLPEKWSLASSVEGNTENRFDITSPETGVFFAGAALRKKRQRVGAMEFEFVTSGEWAFSDEEIAGMAVDILKAHTQTFGGIARDRSLLVLAPFPRSAAADHWSAETRGATVTLLSGKSPSKTAALAQLSFPLAHELFHLWVPNGVALDGDYDWFYEGFTLYQALRAGIRLELFTFQDYLNAMGRAFDAYKSLRDRDRLSLLDASKERWTLQPELVYNKGMLVGFLYDLTLRQRSKGKRTLDDVYRELFRLYHSPRSRSDANSAVIAVLNDGGPMKDFTSRHINNAGTIELSSVIAPFGLQVDPGGVRTHISVAASISGAQRDLLRQFGYNEKTYGVRGHRKVK